MWRIERHSLRLMGYKSWLNRYHCKLAPYLSSTICDNSLLMFVFKFSCRHRLHAGGFRNTLSGNVTHDTL